MSGLGFIDVESNGKCEVCGKIDELRPYGPHGEQICFDCGMKDEYTTKERMLNYVFGEPISKKN